MDSVSREYVYRREATWRLHTTISLLRSQDKKDSQTSHVTLSRSQSPNFGFFPRKNFCSISRSQLLLNASSPPQNITSRSRLPFSSIDLYRNHLPNPAVPLHFPYPTFASYSSNHLANTTTTSQSRLNRPKIKTPNPLQ
jgi:hypothetical protein